MQHLFLTFQFQSTGRVLIINMQFFSSIFFLLPTLLVYNNTVKLVKVICEILAKGEEIQAPARV